jgi:hypothetical protein
MMMDHDSMRMGHLDVRVLVLRAREYGEFLSTVLRKRIPVRSFKNVNIC